MKRLDETSNFGKMFKDLGYQLFHGAIDINGIHHKYSTTPIGGGFINYYDTLSEMRHHIELIKENRAMMNIESWEHWKDRKAFLESLNINIERTI